MAEPVDVAVSTHIDAPAEVVYDLVADLPPHGRVEPGVHVGALAGGGQRSSSRRQVPGV